MFYIPHCSSGVKRDYTTCVNKRAANLRFSSMKDKEKVASIEHLTMSNNISQIGNHSACFLSSVIASRPCHDPASAVSRSCLSCVTILPQLCHNPASAVSRSCLICVMPTLCLNKIKLCCFSSTDPPPRSKGIDYERDLEKLCRNIVLEIKAIQY